MSYHVFIERAQQPGNVAQVAAAIAQRYGLPADAISQRMAAGRFRVKANVDLQTAKKFAADLQRLGAVATVVDAASGEPIQARATAPTIAQPGGIPATAPRPRAPVAGAPKPVVPKPAPAAAGTPPPQPRSTDEFASGLSAAFSGQQESQSLGALESGEFNLSSLDGADDLPTSFAEEVTPTPPPEEESFTPPDDGGEELALLDTETAEAKPAAPAGGDSFAPPADSFAPPSDDSIVDIDDSALTPTPTPPPMRAQTAPEEMTEAQRFSQELAAQHGTAAPAAEQTGGTARQSRDLREQFRELFVDRPRVRFGAGIALVILLAWIPAQIFWSAKVASAQAELNVTLQETVTLAKTDEAVWTDFEDIVSKERDLAGSRLFNKRITAVLIWLGLGGIFGYLYYRKIPWDDI